LPIEIFTETGTRRANSESASFPLVTGSPPIAARELLAVLALSVAWVVALSWLTNTTPPKWDALHYVGMARNGILDNPQLDARFAYRPAVPVLARLVADAFDLRVEQGFQVLGYLGLVGLLTGTFALARCFTGSFRRALLPVAAVGLTGTYGKHPLFFYTLIDIEAFALSVLAIWLLVSGRWWWCFLVSCVGLLFKEWLGVPLALLVFVLVREYWRSRESKYLLRALGAVAIGLTVIVATRLVIPVSVGIAGDRFENLLTPPLNAGRDLNILFSIGSVWLPTLMLMTRQRAARLWQRLGDLKAVLALYVALVLLLTMYGGTNVIVFVSYSLGVQIIVLALLADEVHPLEAALVLCALFVFFRIPWEIPLPEADFDAYIDFYGGWSDRVNGSTGLRAAEIACCVAVAAAARIRLGGARPSHPETLASPGD
jgi:hypothetical protein